MEQFTEKSRGTVSFCGKFLCCIETNMRDWLDAVEILAEEVETEGDSLRLYFSIILSWGLKLYTNQSFFLSS